MAKSRHTHRISKLCALVSQKDACEEMRSTLRINDIEDFAIKMRELGAEYSYPPLVSWGQQLAARVGTFDVEAMERTLVTFPDVVEHIESMTPA